MSSSSLLLSALLILAWTSVSMALMRGGKGRWTYCATSSVSRQRTTVAMESENGNWRKPLIAPEESQNPLSMLRSKSVKGNYERALDLNWKTGMCKHRVSFESTVIIRKLKFCGDLMSFALIDGRVCLIRLSTGDILDKYREHDTEVTALDFDGIHLCSGGADGSTTVYRVTYDSPDRMGTCLHKFQNHQRAVSGMKILTDPSATGRSSAKDSEDSENNDEDTDSDSKSTSAVEPSVTDPSAVMVSCSMDKTVVAVNMTSGETLYTTFLETSPLCMDASGRYLAVGMLNGAVKFLNAKTGSMILSFQAHEDRVRSIHFYSDTILVTGSQRGVVKIWDLSAEQNSADASDVVNYSFQATQKDQLHGENSVRPSRFIDFYFQVAAAETEARKTQSLSVVKGLKNAIDSDSTKKSGNKLDTRVKQFNRSNLSKPMAVVSVQVDETKLLAAYEDGTIVSWDRESQETNFELQGRSNYISTLQFDATRLVADGTSSILVTHDFSDAPEEQEDFTYSTTKD